MKVKVINENTIEVSGMKEKKMVVVRFNKKTNPLAYNYYLAFLYLDQ